MNPQAYAEKKINKSRTRAKKANELTCQNLFQTGGSNGIKSSLISDGADTVIPLTPTEKKNEEKMRKEANRTADKMYKERAKLRPTPLVDATAIAIRAKDAWVHLTLSKLLKDPNLKPAERSKLLAMFSKKSGLDFSETGEARVHHFAEVVLFLKTVEDELNTLIQGRSAEIGRVMAAFKAIALTPESVTKPFVIDLFSMPGEAKSILLAELRLRLGLEGQSITEIIQKDQLVPSFRGLESLIDQNPKLKENWGKPPTAFYAIEEWGNLMDHDKVVAHDEAIDLAQKEYEDRLAKYNEAKASGNQNSASAPKEPNLGHCHPV